MNERSKRLGIIGGLAVAIFIGLFVTGGCSASYWTGTEDVQDSFVVKKSGFGASMAMRSRKDVKAQFDCDKATINPDTGDVDLNGLHVTYDGRATDVIAADASRAMAVGQAQMSQAMYLREWAGVIDSIGRGVSSGLLSRGQAEAMIRQSAPDFSGSLGPQGVTFGTRQPATSQPVE